MDNADTERKQLFEKFREIRRSNSIDKEDAELEELFTGFDWLEQNMNYLKATGNGNPELDRIIIETGTNRKVLRTAVDEYKETKKKIDGWEHSEVDRILGKAEQKVIQLDAELVRDVKQHPYLVLLMVPRFAYDTLYEMPKTALTALYDAFKVIKDATEVKERRMKKLKDMESYKQAERMTESLSFAPEEHKAEIAKYWNGPKQ